MGLDYHNNDFNVWEGVILDSVGANGITNCKVNIQGRTFYLSNKDEDVLYVHIGEYCMIVYGRRSKYVVDYILFEGD